MSLFFKPRFPSAAMGFKEPKDKWFKELKKNRKDFKNVQNIIDSAKFKYDRELELPKWVISIGLTMILGVSFSGFLDFENSLLGFISSGIVLISLGFIMWAIMNVIKIVKIQKVAMAWLYREKDKQKTINF